MHTLVRTPVRDHVAPITRWARRTPDAPALIMAGSGETLTFAQLEARSNQVAHLFRSLGLRAGDHVAFLMENQPLFLVLCWAAQRSGLTYTPLSAHLAAEDAAYILADCDAQVLVAAAALTRIGTDAAACVATLRHCFMAGGIAPGFASLEDAIAALPSTSIADESAGVDLCYSSGTTGKPKGVVKAPLEAIFGDADSIARHAAERFDFSNRSRFLLPNPIYHSAPLRHSMLVQRVGGAVVLMERFDAENVLRSIERYGVTYALFVPTMFVRLLRLPEAVRNRYSRASLARVTHAAAPCPIPVKEQMLQWWGLIITEMYGNTEECGFTAISAAEWLQRKGSIGRATEGVFHALDEHDQDMPHGGVGVLWVEDARHFSYHKDPEKTALSCNLRGWRSVGDVGYLDAQGYVFLTDRSAFTINSGGVKIFPQEVENLLCAHPAVEEVAVFGVPDSEFGEQVKAVVQLKDHGTASPELAAQLIDYCRARLSRIKAPRSIDFLQELPRSALGKLLKKDLREKYWKAT